MKNKKWTLSVALFMLSSVFTGVRAQQQQEWKVGHENGYSYRYVKGDPMAARFYTLKNGLSVMLSVNKNEPRIQTLIGVRAGSNNDPKTHTGLAHYLEHMLFKGTDKFGTLNWAKEKPLIDQIERLYNVYTLTTDLKKRKSIYRQIDSVSGLASQYAIANEYDKLMAAMGGQNTNAHTATEETVYQEDIPSSSLDKYLAVQSERFRYPVMRLFHTELEAVYEEKNSSLDDDSRKVFAALLDGLFPTSNYGQQTTIGTVEHLNNPSLSVIKEFYKTNYVPNNMVVVMAGDFDPSIVVKKIDRAFAYMQPQKLKLYKPVPEQPIMTPVIKEVVGSDAESISIGYRLPGAENNRIRVLLEVLSALLSNGTTGLMDMELNKQQKLQNSEAYQTNFRDYSLLVMAGQAKSEQSLDQVKSLLLAQIEKIKKGDFDEALIRVMVNNFRLDEIIGLENNVNRANKLMDAFIRHKGNNWEAEVTLLNEMSMVTKQQIVDFAKTYFNDNYVLVYKRTGIDTSIVKIDKPEITPIYIDKDNQSPFMSSVLAMNSNPVLPKFLDYEKDIQRGKAGLANVLYVKNTENGFFNLSYHFDMGSWNNKLLPLATEYLKYLGTDKKLSSKVIMDFYNIACSYNIQVGEDMTTITISGLQENFDQAVSLFEEFINGCMVDAEALAGLKIQIAKGRENSKLDKKLILQGLLQYAMYGAKNPFNNQLSASELDDLTADQLIDLLHGLKNYKHTIIYYGPEELAALSKKIEKLHALPDTFKAYPNAMSFTKTNQESNQVLFTDCNMVQAEVYWLRNTDVYNPANTTMLNVFNNYFGEGMGSIVSQTIRESKALAYSTFAQYVSPSKMGERYSQIAYVGTQSDKMGDAINGMNELLNAIPENKTLLENAKQSIRQNIATERISKEAIIYNYLAEQKLGLDGDNRKVQYDQADQVEFVDLQQFSIKYLKGKPYSYCILGSEEQINLDALKQYGEVKKISLSEIFGY